MKTHKLSKQCVLLDLAERQGGEGDMADYKKDGQFNIQSSNDVTGLKNEDWQHQMNQRL
jgi:hypothetical protein